jgi:hypothetical protein
LLLFFDLCMEHTSDNDYHTLANTYCQLMTTVEQSIRKTKKLLNWYLAHLLLNKSKNKSIHRKTLLVASKFYLICILIHLIYI